MLLHVLGGVFVIATVAVAQQACNGDASLCNKPYNQVSYLITHNSYASMPNVAQNQHYDVNTQLKDGIRGLKLSALKSHNNSGVELCHGSCAILDAGPAHDTLNTIASWLNDNPSEVVSIMWNNLGNFKATELQAEYQQVSGIMDLLYVQPANNLTWPTLSDMISSGKRLVNYMDVGADQYQVPWLHDQFSYIFETPYENHNDSQFNCQIDRPQDPTNTEEMMYVMNHFLYGSLKIGNLPIELPQPSITNDTNGQALNNHADNCTTVFQRPPNFIEVDFYESGTTFQVLDKLNNITYTPKTLGDGSNNQKSVNETSSGTDSFGETALDTAAALAFVAIAITILC
ncbi:hypothetical protein INT44_006425 [Umbelopsis vinacea]|uniref:PLC-like phosphodiesterase n=1 Tax=Umbelopsis vinacea TaxID=44442 RepID=A0A8H7PTK1_9FUNG|nr:hypothetical protein INT44_006425 [Umbelopsis vinacea]